MNLDKTYLLWAYKAATYSPDPSTQNGAVIPYKLGIHSNLIESCNTFPEGVKETSERLERPLKYNFIEHAERNAVFAAHRAGVVLTDKILYCPWFACSDCARAIIQSGLRKVVGHKKMFDHTPDHWAESIQNAFTMFEEAGVETKLVEGDIFNAPLIRFNGVLWNPGAENASQQA